YDPLALVGRVTLVEDNIGLLETMFDEDNVLVGLFPDEVTGFKTNAIVIRDSEETLMLAEESRSKMLLKQKDLMMSEKKVNTKLVDYAALNQLSQDFET
nr:hypothetical protein [Tanacetum cinerariifolium]